MDLFAGMEPAAPALPALPFRVFSPTEDDLAILAESIRGAGISDAQHPMVRQYHALLTVYELEHSDAAR